MIFFQINESFSLLCPIATLLCESALLVKGKSFVTLYTDFSFKQLMEKYFSKDIFFTSERKLL